MLQSQPMHDKLSIFHGSSGKLTWRVILVRIRDSIAGNTASTLWRNAHLDILRGGQAHQRRDKGNPEQLKNPLISVAQSRTTHWVLLK